MRRFVVSLLTIATLGIPAFGRASTWDIDPAHTSAQFAVRHLMVSTVPRPHQIFSRSHYRYGLNRHPGHQARRAPERRRLLRRSQVPYDDF
jgi:hypothetical protein